MNIFLIVHDLRVVEKHADKVRQFGVKVRELRLSRSLTQQELAYRCNVDIRTIQRIERGEHGISLHILFALAEALEVKGYELLMKLENGDREMEV